MDDPMARPNCDPAPGLTCALWALDNTGAYTVRRWSRYYQKAVSVAYPNEELPAARGFRNQPMYDTFGTRWVRLAGAPVLAFGKFVKLFPHFPRPFWFENTSPSAARTRGRATKAEVLAVRNV